MSTSAKLPSMQPYYIRALHEWCTDNGFTPYLSVKVDGSVQVPMAFVQNGEIVLNTSYDATSHLTIGNEYLEFQARFGGVLHDILVPIHRIAAIYARENGQGMAFQVQDSVLAGAPPEARNPSDAEFSESALMAEVMQALADDAKPSEAPEDAQVARKVAAKRKSDKSAEKPARTVLTSVSSAAEGEPGSGKGDAPASAPDEPVPPPPGAGAGKRPALRRIK